MEDPVRLVVAGTRATPGDDATYANKAKSSDYADDQMQDKSPMKR